MTAPVPSSPQPLDRLPDVLFHKAVAVRLQLDAFERDLTIAQQAARLAVLERDAMRAQLPVLERQFLDAVHAPDGARFDWSTLTFTLAADPNAAAAPAATNPQP